MAKRDAAAQGKVMVLYASQTGTGQEIARSIQAECAAKGMPSEVMSMNELGFDNLRPDKAPVVVVVASCTHPHEVDALSVQHPLVLIAEACGRIRVWEQRLGLTQEHLGGG